MNCVMMSIIWPVFLLIPVAAGVFGGGFGISSLKEVLLGSLESGQSIVFRDCFSRCIWNNSTHNKF